MFRSIRSFLNSTKKSKAKTSRFFRNAPINLEALEDRAVPASSMGYTAAGSVIAQNFDALPTTGTFTLANNGPIYLDEAPFTTGTNLKGWSFNNNGGTGTIARFAVDSGVSTTGQAFSFGTSATDTNRSLGTLASGTTIPSIGTVIVNNTGQTLNKFTVTYTGQQWRDGGSNNTNSLTFDYNLGGTDISTGTFTAVPALKYDDTVHSTTATALNGHTNQTPGITATITGLNWTPGQTLVLRWSDANDAGSDDGLAIDDVQFSADVQTSAVAITSLNNAIFPVGTVSTFNVVATGAPAPTFIETGALPTGVTLSPSGVLTGMPAAGTAGVYPIAITAHNGIGSDATQNFTLTVAFTQFAFTGTVAAPFNSPSASTGTGSAITLGMTNNYPGHTGDTASDDVLPTSGTASPSFSESTWRIRGAPTNGWATFQGGAGAPQYSQGIELDASTGGFTNVKFLFDWYSTTQGIRDLQFQYNTNVSNATGWTKFGGTSPTGTYIATPNDYYGATATNSHTTIVVDLSSIGGANNNPNFGVRLVSAFDSTGNLPNEYAGAALTGGLTATYNNSSGNWRFANLSFSGTPLTLGSSSTSISASPSSPQIAGTNVTFTATVTPNGATGTVQFKDAGVNIGNPVNLAVVAGVPTATFSTNSLAAGPHTITAVYSGNGTYSGSTSSVANYSIAAASGTTLSVNPNPGTAGDAETLTAVVTPVSATGTVQFKDGSTNFGSPVPLTLVAGVPTAVLMTSTLAAGTHSITAAYSGDGSNLPNTSAATSLTINAVPTITSPATFNVYASVNTTFQIAATGFPTTFTYNVTGLPAWASYSTTTGLITFTNPPAVTTPTPTSLTVTVTNTAGTSVPQTLVITDNSGAKTFTPGNLVILRMGDGVIAYDQQAPLFLDEVTTTPNATAVQTIALPTVANGNNQPITITSSAAAGNGLLNRSADGSELLLGGVAAGINNGNNAKNSSDRVIAQVSATGSIDTHIHGQFDVGDDNRGAVATSFNTNLYNVGHNPNGGTRYFDGAGNGSTLGVQVSSFNNTRGATIGFDGRLYWSTAGSSGTAAAGIYTSALGALPQSLGNDHLVVATSAPNLAKLGGIYLADVNGDGLLDDGDRLYFTDEGTVAPLGFGGLYRSTYVGGSWSASVPLGDGVEGVPYGSSGQGAAGQVRGLTGSVDSTVPGLVHVYVTEYGVLPNSMSYLLNFEDSGTSSVNIVSASTTGTTANIVISTPNFFQDLATVSITGVSNGNYDGTYTLHRDDATHYHYTVVNNISQTATGGTAIIANAAPRTILQLLSDGLGANTANGLQGIRGVAFAPVAPTSITLGLSNATPAIGAPVTFTATLATTAGTPTGTVVFRDLFTNTVLGSGISSTTAGVTTAKFTTSALAGTYSVSAYYGGGTAGFAPTTSNAVTLTQVGVTATSTAVSSSLPTAAVGKAITLTATVTTGGSTPVTTGIVIFKSGSNVLGTGTLNGSGVATLSKSFAAAGPLTITATYGGTATFNTNSQSLSETIIANATVVVTSSASMAPVGSVQTFTATVTGASGTAVDGTVAFKIDGVAIGSAVTLSAAGGAVQKAQVTSAALTVGSHFITVTYTPTGASSPYDTVATTNANALIQYAQQAFTAGNLVVVRRGDGTGLLGNGNTLTFLDEYTQAGALVQSIAMPNADSGTTHTLGISGTSSYDGDITRSANGYYLSLAGFDAPIGTSSIGSSTSGNFPRTVGRIDKSTNINTSTILVSSGGIVPSNVQGVVSNDGNQFWVVSDVISGLTDTGINYATLGTGAVAAPVAIGSALQEGRAAEIFGGQLYVASSQSAFGVIAAVGAGLPTAAGSASLAPLPGLAAAYAAQGFSADPQSFLMFNHLDGTSNKPDTLYIADQTSGLLKFALVGGNWTYQGRKLASAGGASGLTGFEVSPGASGYSFKLFFTGNNAGVSQTANQLFTFTDSAAFDASITLGVPTGFGNPFDTTKGFAGVAFAPGYLTTTTLSDSGSGANYTFTATVTSVGGNVPAGVVVFTVDGSVVGQGTLNASGVATFATTAFPTTGTHYVTAAYQGDVNDGTSTGSLTQAASPIGSADLIVTRVGTTGTLSANGTAIFIDQYNSSTASQASPVQSIALPTTGTSAFTVHGTTTTEGFVATSNDGHSAVIAGYNAAGGASVNGANGVVGVIRPNGSMETSTQIPAANIGGASNSVRAVASADGLGFYVVSPNNHIQYVPFGNSGLTSSTKISNYFPSPNGLAISPSGDLLVDGGAGAQSNGVPAIDGPASIGAGLSINGGQTGKVYLGFPTVSTPNGFPTPNQFAVSPDGNTIFVADSRTNIGGGLLEFFQATPGQWTNVNPGGAGFPIGTAGADSGLRGLSVDFSNPASPIIYGTTSAASGNRIVKITGGTTDGNSPNYTVTTLATAAANQAFRGVSLAPKAAGATPSTMSLSATSTSTSYGAGVTFTATVPAAATGWVSFRQNGIEFGVAPIVGGTATFNSAGNLGAGAASVVAFYTGDSTYAPSTSTPALSATVTKATTTTALVAAFTSIATNTPDLLSATITVPAGTAPTGSVTFWDGGVGAGTNLGTSALSQLIVNQGGSPTLTFTASVSAAFSTVGAHNVTAVYNGDNNFTATSDTQIVNVVLQSTTVVTTSNPSPAATGASVTLTATVNGTTTAPTGTVQFYDNLLPIGSPVNLTPGTGNAVASVTVSTALLQAASKLTPGLHSISALYTGDGNYFKSTGVYQQAVQAQAFGATNQFVYRVGDGTTNLIAQAPNPIAGNGSIGCTIFVDEYTPAGTLVQSIILPSADGAGSQSAIHAVVGNGQQSNTGQMSLSGDGRYLFLAGYDNNPLNVATANAVPTQASAVNTPRSIARIKFDGTVETIAFPAGATGVETAGNFNGVYSPDGNQFYVGGVAASGSGTGGLFYYSSFTPSAALQPATATITGTGLAVGGIHGFGGNVAVATFGAAALVQQYTGLPTAAATPASLPGVSFANSAQASQFTVDFYFTHLNGPGTPAGLNTLYITDDGPSFAAGTITKWSLVNGTWVNTFATGGVQGTTKEAVVSGTGNSAIDFYWLSGVTDGSGNVTLYSTYGNGGNANTGPGFLYSIVDTNGFNAPIGAGGAHSDAVSVVATVPTGSNKNIRGVASAPKSVVSATTTTLTAAPNASTGGQLVTFTATVAPSPGAAGTVTFKDNGGPLAGGSNIAVVGGVAVFQTSSLTPGSHPITAEYSGDTAAGFIASTSTPLSYVVTSAATAPQVVSITPNANIASMTGAQHSRVASLVVVFDKAVQLDPNAMTLALHTNNVIYNGAAQPTGYGDLPTSLSVASTDNITWVVTFVGNTDTGADGFNSLKDGVYDLNIDATKVHSSGVSGVNMAANVTNTFHRLFGDTNAAAQTGADFNAIVNSSDNLAFRGAFNKVVGDGYLTYLDFGGDGVINSGDNLQFRTRFNKALTWKA